MALVSVIIPTSNRVDFLRDAVESVLTQTYEQLECIIVIDGSTDGTQEYLETINDDRLRVLARDKSNGVAAARNAGIGVAEGDYIVSLDDDDRLYETAVEVLVNTISEQPSHVAGVYTAQRQIDQSDNTTVTSINEGKITEYEAANIGGPSCTLLRAAIVGEIGGFDETFVSKGDADFWIRLFDEFSMIAVSEPLYERRLHDDQMIEDPELMITGGRQLLEKHGNNLSAAFRASRYYEMGQNYIQLEQPKLARKQFREAIRENPRRKASYYYYFWLLFGSTGYRVGQLIHHRLYRKVTG